MSTVRSRLWNWAFAIGAAAAVATGGAAQADTWPSRAVRVVVPFAAGGTADLVARVVTDGLSQRIGQPFVVENRPGAGGTVGSDFVAKASPDGYTLGIGSVSTHATAVSLYPNLPYHPVRDFTPVALLGAIPNVMVVTNELKVSSVKQFVEAAGRQPLNYGSIGNGTSQHLGGELFKLVMDIDMTHIPYRQNAALVNDLITGAIHVIFDNLPNVLGQVKGGRLTALAVTVPERWSGLPDTPSMKELGYPELSNISSWVALFGPAGMSPDIARRLESEAVQIMQRPEVQQRLVAAGVSPKGAPARELSALINAEIERWATVIRKSGAKID